MTSEATEITTSAAPQNGEQRTFTRMLRVRVSNEERMTRAIALEAGLAERDALIGELDDIKRSFKERMERLDERIAKARMDFATGTEERAVRCAEEPQFERNVVLIRRLDTLEVIEERAMEREERQLEIDMPTEGASDGVGEDEPAAEPGEVRTSSADVRERKRRRKAREAEGGSESQT